MSSVFLTRRGAGGSVSGAYAVIGVTYPVGSLCTVSRDGVVYRDLSRDDGSPPSRTAREPGAEP